MRIDVYFLYMAVLTTAMTMGCVSESPSRVAFRDVVLGSPIKQPQLSTFRQKCVTELIWMNTRDGKVVSKVWARADFAGIGCELPYALTTTESIPPVVIEQEPWLITYRFEFYGLRDIYNIGTWTKDPSAILAALFPHSDSILTEEVISNLHIRIGHDDSTVVIEDDANRLWLEVSQLKDCIHIRGYLSVLWPTPRPSEYPFSDLFADRISPLANLAGWCWYQARVPASRDTVELLKEYRRFRGVMLNSSGWHDLSRTRSESRVELPQ